VCLGQQGRHGRVIGSAHLIAPQPFGGIRGAIGPRDEPVAIAGHGGVRGYADGTRQVRAPADWEDMGGHGRAQTFRGAERGG